MGSEGTAAGKRQGGSLWDMVPKGWRGQKSLGNSSGLEENSVEQELGGADWKGTFTMVKKGIKPLPSKEGVLIQQEGQSRNCCL